MANWARAGTVAISMIAAFEGCYTYAYRDPVGIPTVCFGHIEHVQMGDRYTQNQCKQMLLDDLPRYEAQVDKCIHVQMPPHRAAAILSFTYNVGGGALCKSSVARGINNGDVQAGCDALLLYKYAKGLPLPGLKKRREEERLQCLRND